MDAKTVRETFKNLPDKRKQVLLRVLASDTKQKIACELCGGSETAVQQNLRQLYKNFHIREDRERKLPALINLFARCMPELISARTPEVLEGVEHKEVIANKHTVTNPLESDTAPKISIEASSFLEYFSKSIDQLQNKALDVRIGAISALGTLAKYSQPAEHWTIMEYLAAFIRTNAPRKEEKEGEEERSPKISEDIQVALTVIGQRDSKKDPPDKMLNLSNTDLRGADLSKAKLEGAFFIKVNLEKANLCEANLQRAFLNEANLQESVLLKANLEEANLCEANLQRAYLTTTSLQCANFSGAKLEGADFTEANLQCANFSGAKLEGADFTKASLKGAYFGRANLNRAYLIGANLEEADLGGASLQGTYLYEADLSKAKNLELKEIESAHRDIQTLLPDSLTQPTYWKQFR